MATKIGERNTYASHVSHDHNDKIRRCYKRGGTVYGATVLDFIGHYSDVSERSLSFLVNFSNRFSFHFSQLAVFIMKLYFAALLCIACVAPAVFAGK